MTGDLPWEGKQFKLVAIIVDKTWSARPFGAGNLGWRVQETDGKESMIGLGGPRTNHHDLFQICRY